MTCRRHRLVQTAPPLGVTLVLALLLRAWPVAAHDFWIEPSHFRPEVGSTVRVGLRVGDHFRGQPVPRRPSRIARFFLSHRGEIPIPGLAGADPAGVVQLQGTAGQWLAYEGKASRLQLAAGKFESYLRQEGLEAISHLRARRGETETGVSELFFRHAKALLCPPGARADAPAPLGLTLELVPEIDLCRASPGDEVPFRVQFQGRPLPGALVVALPRRAPEKPLTARSGAHGKVLLRLGRPGAYLVKVVHMTPAPPQSGADWQSFWASLTFAILP